MELFKWTAEYSVSSEEIDAQHKKLFEITNKLYSAFSSNEHKEKLGGILEDLHEYAVYHFSEEEKLLASKGEPLSPEHKLKHKEFIDKIEDFRTKFQAGRLAVTYEMMSFLRDWLISHIKGTDKQYSKAFK